MNKEIKKIKRRIVSILKERGVVKAGIFGSYARGEQKKNSDIDILIEIRDNNVSLFDLIALKRILEIAVKKKVDLVEYECIRDELKQNILRDEISII